MHTLILGRTASGKTLLARRLTESYRRAGILALVLDPIGDPKWAPFWKTADGGEFVRYAMACRRCALFLDESGETVGQHRSELFWTATRARHLGHSSHFLAQRAPQITPTVRDQCERLVLFAVGADDAVELARDWGKPELRDAPDLPQFHYLTCGRFGGVSRGVIDPPSLPPPPQVDEPATQTPAAPTAPPAPVSGDPAAPGADPHI